MPAYIDGEFLNRSLSPQLLFEFRNNEDTFTSFLGKVNAAAATSDGVSIQKLINDIKVKTGLTEAGLLDSRKLAGKKKVIPWQLFTTEALYFDKEELRALAFDKKAAGRQLLIEAVRNAILRATLHDIAPSADSVGTPLVSTTGADDGTGRLMMVPKDIISLLRRSKIKNPVQVLCKNHLLDLQENEESKNRFKDMMIGMTDLKPMPYAGVNNVAGDIDIRYTPAGNKRALDAASVETDRFASVFIDKTNTLYFVNNLFFTYQKAENDTTHEIPRESIRIYGEFIGTVIDDTKLMAAIVDGVAPEPEV